MTRGGGVILYVSNACPSSPVDFLPNATPGLEITGCIISTIEGALHLIAVYRSPSSSPESDELLTQFLQTISTKKADLLILGDFNAPLIDWASLTCQTPTSFSNSLLEVSLDSGLHQAISIPTRYRGVDNPSTLDLAFSKYPDTISDIVPLPPLGKSDHIALVFKHQVIFPRKTKHTEPRFLFHKINRSILHIEASRIYWQGLQTFTELDEFYANAKEVLH